MPGPAQLRANQPHAAAVFRPVSRARHAARSKVAGSFIFCRISSSGTITDQIVANGGGLGQTRILVTPPVLTTRPATGNIRRRATGNGSRHRRRRRVQPQRAYLPVQHAAQPHLGRTAPGVDSRHVGTPPVYQLRKPRPRRRERRKVRHRPLPQRFEQAPEAAASPSASTRSGD